ncbi:Aromatic ring-opening dioxygenase, catalytic subunit, LigB family [Alteromonadaceae bacterium Bs31]|nr:Aromatic ring-opening dioxygenase, catalytic subunit, LigB family [Alteromonadaceae bacterium Bs31]
MNSSTTILSIPHGGGPLPLLGDASHAELVQQLRRYAESLEKPSAILVISAHWEEKVPTITSAASPQLIYDYYGFPEQAYQVQYPCVGEPQLAQKVYQALSSAGISANLDEHRGFDHGLFVPLKIMYPDATIPCVQLSLVNTLDAELHLKIGQALAALEYENLLVLGSGFTFHNMRAFYQPETGDALAKNSVFQEWLVKTLSSTELTEPAREQALLHWHKAPHARYCHPREEHLLPLHICYGAAGRACDEYELTKVAGVTTGFFCWREIR